MTPERIIETINRFFISVDARDWEVVKGIFMDDVFLDYTSMYGGEPATIPSEKIIETWKGFLPGFDKTHHQVGNYLVEIYSGLAKVFCYVTATHYLASRSSDKVWTVVGSYDLELIFSASIWRIKKMKFNLKYVDGNKKLPKLALDKLKKKK